MKRTLFSVAISIALLVLYIVYLSSVWIVIRNTLSSTPLDIEQLRADGIASSQANSYTPPVFVPLDYVYTQDGAYRFIAEPSALPDFPAFGDMADKALLVYVGDGYILDLTGTPVGSEGQDIVVAIAATIIIPSFFTYSVINIVQLHNKNTKKQQ